MQTVCATVTNLAPHLLADAITLADKAAPDCLKSNNWRRTDAGTINLQIIMAAGQYPRHRLAMAQRMVQAWLEAGFCANGLTSAGACINKNTEDFANLI